MAMTEQEMLHKWEIRSIRNEIESLAEKYHKHPDKVARLYAAMREVCMDVGNRMEEIRENERVLQRVRS